MRLTEQEYEDLIKRRAGQIRDTAHQLNIPAPRNAEKLAEDTIPLSSYPVKMVQPREVPNRFEYPAPAPSKRTMNKTETAYLNRLKCEFPGATIRFEAITLRLHNGHRYTPDFVVDACGSLLLIEVKNAAYKHASYGRSKMAYAQAQIDFPMFRYRWAEKTGSEWYEQGEL